MKTVEKWKTAAGGIFVLLLLLIGWDYADRRLTYIESTQINERMDLTTAIADNQTILEQEFCMPYERMYKVDIRIGTFGRNNNSFWNVELKEKESGKKVYDWKFNASEVTDGEYYSLSTGFPIRVRQGEIYSLSISSVDSTGYSALAFYTSEGDVYKNGNLYLNGEIMEADLSFQVSGGERDGFWTGLYGFYSLYLLVFLLYSLQKYRKGTKLLEDRLFLTLLIAGIIILLTYIFSRTNMGDFTDECDNIRGGMLIARGKVLYRDYYAQHTPFVYYLCSVFALFGAGSVQQFRLLYYILLAAVWAGLYYRHCDYFGKVRMFLLPILQIVLVIPMFFQGSKILGDNVQGICMAALILEFLRYIKDRELRTSRCLIVSACIYASVMSTFVSLFALVPIIFFVFFTENSFWKEKGEIRFKEALSRYWKLSVFSTAPFAATVAYFACNHALRQFYLMAYQFNTIVYRTYQNEFGRVKWKPFVLGIVNFFIAVSRNLEELLTAVPGSLPDTASRILPLLFITAVCSALVSWVLEGEKGKRILPALCLFLCITGNMTRESTGFHVLPAWNAALTVIVMLGGGIPVLKNRKAATAAAVFAVCCCIQPFTTLIGDHIVYRQPVIDGIDKEVVELTEPGEEIFIDALIHDSIYLLYKDRYPVNRNCYILPWYMDWFEHDTIVDLETSKPRIAVYNPASEPVGVKDFCLNLTQWIQTHYTRESEETFIWQLK